VTRVTSARRSGCDHEDTVEALARLKPCVQEGSHLTPGPVRDMRVLMPVLGAVVVATLLLAAAVWVRGGRVDGSPAASVGPTTPAEPPAPTTAPPVAAPTTAPPVAAPTTGRPSSFSRVIQWMNVHGPTGGGRRGRARRPTTS